MEKRFYFGLGILIFLLVLGVVATLCLDDVNKPIAFLLEQASQAPELETGISLAQKAKAQWEDAWHRIAMVADHTPMDEIDSLFAQMEIHAAAGDHVAFGGYCARLSQLVEAIADAHRLNWWNLL